MHSIADKTYTVANGAIADVPEEVAKVWLKIKGVVEHVDVRDYEALKAETEQLKKDLANTKKSNSKKSK